MTPENMDAEDVFLSCSNLTLGQYKVIVLTRGVVGAAGCVVSLAVLGIVLLTTKKRSWENLTKRIYLAIILYTFLYFIVTIAAVNYSHPPSQESAWCETMGFLLQYTGTLVVVQYCALAFTAVFQIAVPVYQATRKKHDDIHSSGSSGKAKLWWEVLLFLILFLCPTLNTWEPFLPQLPSYGNYGPLCWFRLQLTDNCTTSTSNVLFLHTIPFAVVCFGYSVLTFTISLVLCRMYCKFHMKTIGSRIIRVLVIPIIAIVTVTTFMIIPEWFVLSAVPSKSLGRIGSFSGWLRNVTVTTVSTIGMLVVVGVYVYFPTYFCQLYFKRGLHSERERNREQVVHPPKVAHHNAQAMYTNLHSPVTTVTPPPEVDKHSTDTTCNIPHSPVTTECTFAECTPLISAHPPEVDYHTTCSISHEPVTTNNS